ncbi:MAG: CDP-diacylglycerol--glycerol-3-phosphate 3-phosphatidyltransferase [Verrucomicrobiaceae bacterium]|nr:CDP-diacylglycerol--glycerol-3-phosphate 3-phosphatidyltransferase [Verrucomicrobiaceae bacterium]
MNLPNKLSLTRLFLVGPFVALFYLGIERPFTNGVSWSLIVFLIASATDYLDGYIARSCGLVTNFGKLFDPLADKILMASALTMLAIERAVPAWIVIAILAREFFVTGIRQIAVSQGVVIAAERLGKHKMVWQIITTIYFLLKIAADREAMFSFARGWFDIWVLSPAVFGNLCIYLTAVLTLVSGATYFWNNRGIFSDK